MNGPHAEDLMDEHDLRLALLPWRADPKLFAAGVRQRIGQSKVRLSQAVDCDQTTMDHSSWLQTAAAVIPIPLLSKGSASGLVKLGQLSLGKKLVAWAALPATGLLLMLAATVWAVLKVRQAQRGQPTGGTDVGKLAEVTAQWWRQFGVVNVALSFVLLLLMLSGTMLPMLIIFLVSGAAMVALISRLGQAGLVDRQTVAGALSPGLLVLVQVTHTTTMLSHGTPLLDQMLIPALLLAAGLVVTIMCDWPLTRAGTRTWISCIPMVLLAGWFSSSLWNPVSIGDLKSSVESFNHARFSSASWKQWQVPAEWLRDAKIEVDLSKPRALLQAELDKADPNRWVLSSAIEAGLMQVSDLDRVPDLAASKKRVFDEFNRGRPFISVGYEPRILIHALVMRHELSEEERNFLSDRLVATMESLRTQTFGSLLEEQLAITKLAALIDRPIDIDSVRGFVHETLLSHQRLGNRLAVRAGGFAASPTLDFSDEYATADAIELMQIYGVPPTVSIDALRSYLRPSYNDKWQGLSGQAYVRAASSQRLSSLPEVRPLTWMDYYQHEQNLMMAILFTLVCVFATLGAPNLRSSS